MARPKRRSSAKSSTKNSNTARVASAMRASSSSAAVAGSATSTGMKPLSAQQLTKIFVVWMVGHTLVVWLANYLFPMQVVLGNSALSPMVALVLSMVVFTLIAVGALPVIEYVAEIQKKRLMTMDWMVLYAVINTVGFWVVARFAEQLGLGLGSWLVALALGLVVDMIQGVLIMKAT